MGELWPLVMLWSATAALPVAVVLFVQARRRLAEGRTGNVVVLPPCAQRSGPTHVVKLPRIYDHSTESA